MEKLALGQNQLPEQLNMLCNTAWGFSSIYCKYKDLRSSSQSWNFKSSMPTPLKETRQKLCFPGSTKAIAR